MSGLCSATAMPAQLWRRQNTRWLQAAANARDACCCFQRPNLLFKLPFPFSILHASAQLTLLPPYHALPSPRCLTVSPWHRLLHRFLFSHLIKEMSATLYVVRPWYFQPRPKVPWTFLLLGYWYTWDSSESARKNICHQASKIYYCKHG